MCENALPGDPESNRQVAGTGAESIQGYATSMSVNAGDTQYLQDRDSVERLPHRHPAPRLLPGQRRAPHRIRNQTDGAAAAEPAGLPHGFLDRPDRLRQLGSLASWTVPSDAVSGVYIAHLVRDDAPNEDSQIIFVVRNDTSKSNLLLQTSDATWQAYNTYGGNSLYQCTVACPPGSPETYKGADAVSYNRPFVTPAPNNFFYAEYQLVRFLEQNGYDVSYTSEAEVDQNGALLKTWAGGWRRRSTGSTIAAAGGG